MVATAPPEGLLASETEPPWALANGPSGGAVATIAVPLCGI